MACDWAPPPLRRDRPTSHHLRQHGLQIRTNLHPKAGVHQTLIVSSWEIAKECFTVNDKAFASRPKLVAAEVMDYNYGMVGFSPYGDYWRHVRKIATLEVLSNHRLEMLRHVRESEVRSAMKDTYDRWVELNKNSGYHQNPEAMPLSCEMKTWFGDITLNVCIGWCWENVLLRWKATKGFVKHWGICST